MPLKTSANFFMRLHGVGEKAKFDEVQEKPSLGSVTKYVTWSK